MYDNVARVVDTERWNKTCAQPKSDNCIACMWQCTRTLSNL